jgi:serine/threonine-protein kinase
LLYSEIDDSGVSHIGVLPLDGSREETLMLSAGFTQSDAAMHPAGRWMAYTSNESGRSEIYVRPFPDVQSGRWQVTTDGGARPVWGPGGRELFYWLNGRIAVAPIELQPAFAVGKPVPVSAAEYYTGPAGVRSFEVAADGRILALKLSDEVGLSGREIRVVLNWTDELKQQVPTRP